MATQPSKTEIPKNTEKPAEPSKAAGFVAPDWERIELDYRAGVKSLREISDGSGVSHVTISKRAKKSGWVRDLTAKIQAKADELVNRSKVNSALNTVNVIAERKIVEENAQAIADIRLSHRVDFQRTRRLANSMLSELEQQTDPETLAMLRDLGTMMRQDKRNDLYNKVIDLTERSKTLKTLTESLQKVVDMERQAFGMDAKDADKVAPGSPNYIPPAITVMHVSAPRRVDDGDDML